MNNQLARIIELLNEHGYEINDRGIDETNAFEAVELVLAQLVDAHTALDADTKPITIKLPLAVSVGGQGFREQVVDILTKAGIKVEEAE